MLHWILIFIGVFFLSVSVSNPVYKITIRKYLKINFLFQLITRFLLFLLGVIIIFYGLYLESIF